MLMGLSTFSQLKYPIAQIDVEGDTVMVFSLFQSRDMAKKIAGFKACKQNKTQLEIKIVRLDSVVGKQKSRIDDKDEVIARKDSIIGEKEIQINAHQSIVSDLDDEIKKQKTGKFIAIGAAVVVSIVAILR